MSAVTADGNREKIGENISISEPFWFTLNLCFYWRNRVDTKVVALDLSLEGFSAPDKASYTQQIDQFQWTMIHVKRQVLVHSWSIC